MLVNVTRLRQELTATILLLEDHKSIFPPPQSPPSWTKRPWVLNRTHMREFLKSVCTSADRLLDCADQALNLGPVSLRQENLFWDLFADIVHTPKKNVTELRPYEFSSAQDEYPVSNKPHTIIKHPNWILSQVLNQYVKRLSLLHIKVDSRDQELVKVYDDIIKEPKAEEKAREEAKKAEEQEKKRKKKTSAEKAAGDPASSDRDYSAFRPQKSPRSDALRHHPVAAVRQGFNVEIY